MGVLTLPVAIKNSGLVFGSIGLAVIAYICVHCMKMLVGAAHKVNLLWWMELMKIKDILF